VDDGHALLDPGRLAASDDRAVGDVLDEFGERSFAPFMLILAIIGILAACWCSRRSCLR